VSRREAIPALRERQERGICFCVRWNQNSIICGMTGGDFEAHLRRGGRIPQYVEVLQHVEATGMISFFFPFFYLSKCLLLKGELKYRLFLDFWRYFCNYYNMMQIAAQ
jgi:hypothetical protein